MALIDKETICAEIERIMSRAMDKEGQDICEYILEFLDTLPEQPVTDCHDLEEEIDNAIYGGFYSHCRVASGELPDREPGMYVQIKEGGPWLPVNDWKHHRYIATDDTIKRIARHFAEWGAENLKR